MPIRRTPAFIAKLLFAALLPACAIGCAPFARAAAVSVDVELRGQSIVIEASTRLDSDPATAWRVLTDYDRYGDFIPGVISSRVVDRRGSTVVVEQSDQLPLWLLRMPLHVRYAIREFPPNLVQSRATTDALPALESSYLLTPARVGVRLEYVGHVDPGGLLLAGIEERVFRQRVLHQFTALAHEIERRSALARRVD